MESQNIMSQEDMEKTFPQYVSLLRDMPGGCFDGQLSPEFIRCNYENKTLVYRFDSKPWMRNPGGVLHGGIISSMMDDTMGNLTTYLSGGKITPTISMQVCFISPGFMDKPVYIGCHCRKCGKTTAFVTAKAWQDDENQPFVTADAVYYTAGPKNDLSQY